MFKSVFIMLGSECNAHCSYCLQKGEHKKLKLPTEINDEILDYIERLASEFVPSEDNEYFFVVYFGGEPLLYWDKIKYINEKLLERGVIFRSSIITNGILLNKEKAEYLNKHCFNVSLSYDGEKSIKTRFFDVFDMKNAADLFSIDRLTINAVLTKYSYPMEILESVGALNEIYYNIHGHDMHLNIETLIDTGGCNDFKMNDMDSQRLHDEIYEITMGYLQRKYEDNPFDRLFSRYAEHMLNLIKQGITEDKQVKRGNCLCGWAVANVDLGGNLYRCHNASVPIADIHSEDYFDRLAAADQRTHDTHCNDCDVKYLCNGGCKMVAEELEDRYCEVQRSYYVGFYNALTDWGKD